MANAVPGIPAARAGMYHLPRPVQAAGYTEPHISPEHGMLGRTRETHLQSATASTGCWLHRTSCSLSSQDKRPSTTTVRRDEATRTGWEVAASRDPNHLQVDPPQCRPSSRQTLLSADSLQCRLTSRQTLLSVDPLQCRPQTHFSSDPLGSDPPQCRPCSV